MNNTVSLSIDGRAVIVPAGITVAAALAIQGNGFTRRAIGGAMRTPVCGMGICQECRVTIDGVPHRLACQTLCANGMRVETANTENAIESRG
ncbi:(2Fe-2S)-binding protein [Noviherbaspirillum denitrificans]|uniref:Ferredoxin n=1 Tax=Noviherbaspirillum denitrificans TaxID=1968433 RepID=A0A254TFT5_9BURK|nr:(2Fe-2S)-binding protein [Noviherbaspirillum denitrificans]OWW21385.1 ferredoxin [Noviherbaspirillum denitrificans]